VVERLVPAFFEKRSMDSQPCSNTFAMTGTAGASQPDRSDEMRPLNSRALFALMVISAFRFPPASWAAGMADPYQAMGISRPDHAIQALNFSLPTFAGGKSRLADYRGKVVLLNFWATWCAPCREEMPSIQTLWERYKDKGLVVLAVSEDDGKRKQIADFIGRTRLQFPILLDHDFKIANRYILPGLPTTYLIGRDGTIAATLLGTQDWSRHEARALIEYLLERRP
jgi:peroxiredoxin